MRILIFLLTFTMAMVPPPLRAQDAATVPPPAPPFVLPPPERSAWTINVTRPAPADEPQDAQNAQKSSVVVAISSSRYGESKRDVVSRSDGSKMEVWFVEENVYWPYPDGSRVGVSSENPDELTNEPITSARFPGLDWLDADAYKGIVKIGDQACRHYAKGGEGDRWEAWISLESQLPVAARFGDVIHSYSFMPPPTGPLQLPAIYAKALAETKARAARAAALADLLRRR